MNEMKIILMSVKEHVTKPLVIEAKYDKYGMWYATICRFFKGHCSGEAVACSKKNTGT